MSSGWKVGFFGTGSPAGTVNSTSPAKGETINRIRDDLILLGSIRHTAPLTVCPRSTVIFPAVADTYEDHPEYWDVSIDWDKLAGGQLWTVQARIECRCEDAAVTITPRMVLAGTGTLVGTAGTAHNTVGWGSQTIGIPSSSGIVTYRLQTKRSALTAGVRAIAMMELYAPTPDT